ncbi:MAG: hypothetical protein M0P61_04660 [Ignavibacteriaceae bacterium]|jgi:hypothetical protein|nr:hypothetical protein [Ignavibacteriaceae bacterium]
MKTLFTWSVLLLISYPVVAQDSTGVKDKKEKTTLEAGKNENFSFDKKKKNDVFIDKDGDGICDFRTKGMSFEKFRKRNRQGLGEGKGKGKN